MTMWLSFNTHKCITIIIWATVLYVCDVKPSWCNGGWYAGPRTREFGSVETTPELIPSVKSGVYLTVIKVT